MPWFAPYRVPLFRELSSAPDMRLTVLFCSSIESGRSWQVPKQLPFAALFLQSRNLGSYRHRDMFGDSVSIQYPSGLLRALRTVDPHIVITYEFHLASILAMIYARVHHCKFIIWSDVTAIHDARMGRLRWMVRRLLLSGSHALIGSSTDTILHFHGSFGYPRDTSFLSILSAHVDDLMKAAPRPSQPRTNRDEDVRFLCVGRLIPQKGLDLLLRAFSRVRRSVPNTVLTLIGDGPQRTDLESLAVQLGCSDSLVFQHFMPQEDLVREMHTHDVFVFPTRLDVFGLVVAEAVACGLPIICSRWAGAARDLVSRNGFIVDPLNIPELASAMRELATNTPLRAEMRQAGQEVLQKHNLTAAVAGFLSAIRTAGQSSG